MGNTASANNYTRGGAWVDVTETWMNPLIDYLRDGILPLDLKEASRIQKKSQWFFYFTREPSTRRRSSNPYYDVQPQKRGAEF